jgi:glycosyltransferase involved in cell wall biosynthesis
VGVGETEVLAGAEPGRLRQDDVSKHCPNRVGLVAPLPPQMGGVASFAEWIVAHQAEIGCEYRIFDLWRPVDAEAGGRFRLAAVARQVAQFGRFVRWTRSAPALVHYCVSLTPAGLVRDLAYVAILRLAGRRVLAHVHGPSLPATGGQGRAALLRILARLSYGIVTLSPSWASAFRRHGIETSVVVNPVRPLPRPAAQTNKADETLSLLFVGAYGVDKGAPELLAAAGQARQAGIEVEVRFVGKEARRGDRTLLAHAATGAGLESAVTFAGPVDAAELSVQYQSADLFCLPSHAEGLPMALLEAMESGLPVIASRVGAIADVMDDGEDGILVEPGDVEGLAEAIVRLGGDPSLRRRMGEHARMHVGRVASPSAISSRWSEIYRRCSEGLPQCV